MALLFALLPMLTFMGHWPTSVAVPGTNFYVTIPFAGAHTEGGDEHNHNQHCHGDSAGCSDVRAAAGVGVALLHDAVVHATGGGVLLLLALRWWIPAAGLSLIPDLRPPRRTLSMASIV